MNPFYGLSTIAAYGIMACSVGLALLLGSLLAPRPLRLPDDRRRPATAPGVSSLTTAATQVTSLVDRVLRRGRGGAHEAVLARAGVTMRTQDFFVLMGVGVLVAAAAGVVLSGPLLGVVLAAVVPLLVRVRLGMMAGSRRKAFANQLDDSLQLIASSLRAGHSMLQALASVAREAESPTSVEFARIINETRVGRPLNVALDETAARMESEDFVWVTQAIAINREVGGNLAEVLDGVAHTIRERNQIRRQVKALSAEGKLSAYVLMALPIGIAGFLRFSNPAYMAKFTSSLIGYGMIGACVLLFVMGGLWLRKVVSFAF